MGKDTSKYRVTHGRLGSRPKPGKTVIHTAGDVLELTEEEADKYGDQVEPFIEKPTKKKADAPPKD